MRIYALATKYQILYTKYCLLCLLSSVFFASTAHAGDAVTPGEMILERPTLQSVGFEWRISGDENGDASCNVQYRKKGDEKWNEYLPLFRIGQGVRIWFAVFCGWPQYKIPDALAGSIMDLEPGTEYEVKLTLSDPDGVEGETAKTLSLKTRPEPKVQEGGEVRHVYPPDWKGKKEKNTFKNIMHALNGYAPICDNYQTIHPNVAKPGTVIKMHGGLHTYDTHKYFDNGKPGNNYWVHGTITVMAKGTPEKPIYIIPAGDGEVIIDGDGTANLFNLRSAEYLHFEGLTIRNTDIAFHCGWQGLKGGGMKGLTVKNCWIEGVTYGVLAQDGASEDFNILDNVFIGCNPHYKANKWGRTTAGYAVNLGGQGHTVSHNYVTNFWDGLNVFTNAISDPAYNQQVRAIDITDNDINNMGDNAIESDGGYTNIRVLRNRLFYAKDLSTQMVYAGPVYWIRNVVYEGQSNKSLYKCQLGTQAFVALHNTSSTYMHIPPNTWWRPSQTSFLIQNNLCVGADGEKKTHLQYPTGEKSKRHVIDYNAYNRGAADAPCVIAGNKKKGIKEKKFAGFEAMREATGYEEHSLMVDGFNVFSAADKLPRLENNDRISCPCDLDMRPAEGAPVVDAGVGIPGINDDFKGEAPDIGAYEAGQALPVYGPRSGPYLERLAQMKKGEYVPLYAREENQSTD